MTKEDKQIPKWVLVVEWNLGEIGVAYKFNRREDAQEFQDAVPKCAARSYIAEVKE